MSLERFCVKFFTQPGADIDDTVFIEIFHEWIRLKTLNGVLLDVADYRHVPNGPGIMLISHEINFAMDSTNGRFGILAQRKLGKAANHRGAVLELVAATLKFAALLENDPRTAGKLDFDAGAFEYSSNDRLLAPNTPAAFTDLLPDLQSAAAVIYPGQKVLITRIENDPRDRLTIRVDTGALLSVKALAEAVVA